MDLICVYQSSLCTCHANFLFVRPILSDISSNDETRMDGWMDGWMDGGRVDGQTLNWTTIGWMDLILW